MPKRLKKRGKGAHFIGIGGAGMNSLAGIMLAQGWSVSGSDASASDATERLVAQGAVIHVGQDPAHVCDDVEIVVVSAAIKESNPELAKARKLGKRILKYAQMLGELMGPCRGIAVSGSHGKTTTTAMISYVLDATRKSPTFVVGGYVTQLECSSKHGKSDWFVAEACEYDRSFHNLRPEIAVVMNVEADHLDYYADLGEIIESFRHFVNSAGKDGLAVVGSDSPGAVEVVKGFPGEVETFAIEGGADWTPGALKAQRGRYSFNVLRRGKKVCKVSLSIPGLHNVQNALATAAACSRAGVDPKALGRAISGFKGVGRRFEIVFETPGIAVVDDYGHHPTHVRAVIAAAKEAFPEYRLVCVFQPHQHSRTRQLLDDFAASFAGADHVIIPDIFYARDPESEVRRISSAVLVERILKNGVEAEHIAKLDSVIEALCAACAEPRVILTVGAGDVWKVARELKKRFERG
jgi:UDP-N-acetylmuramate--alanine ligase